MPFSLDEIIQRAGAGASVGWFCGNAIIAPVVEHIFAASSVAADSTSVAAACDLLCAGIGILGQRATIGMSQRFKRSDKFAEAENDARIAEMLERREVGRLAERGVKLVAALNDRLPSSPEKQSRVQKLEVQIKDFRDGLLSEEEFEESVDAQYSQLQAETESAV